MSSIWRSIKAWYVFVLPLRFNFAVLAILLFAFRFSDQGLDILKSMSQRGLHGHRWPLAAFIIASNILALELWYWSRHLLRYRPHAQDTSRDPVRSPLPSDFPVTNAWLPRFLGLAVFLIEIGGFVHVGGRQGVFGWIVGLLFASASAYLAFVLGRRALLGDQGRAVITRWSEFGALTRNLLVGAIVAEAVFFVWAVCAPVSWNVIEAGATLVLTVAVWVPLGTFFVGVGERARFPVFTAFLVWAFAISRCTDNHAIRITNGPVPRREKLQMVFDRWYARVAPQHSGGDVPVIVVATEGGGIRAAYWTATVLAELQDKEPRFADHVFAISGVSGGSLGAVIFDSILMRHLPPSTTPLKPDVRAMLQYDALSGTLAAMAQPDFLQRFFPFPVLPDREAALESGWERAWTAAFGDDSFHKPLVSTVNGAPVPNLFLNGTVVETGDRIVTSNVVIQKHSLLGFRNAFDGIRELAADLPMSAAAGMSARFTYVSPAGKIPYRRDDRDRARAAAACGGERANMDCGRALFGHVVDGGYFENSGAVTAAEIVAFLFEEKKAGKKVRPVVVVIDYWDQDDHCASDPAPNCPAPGDCGPIPPKKAETFANELLSPLRGVLNARGARGNQAIGDIAQQMGADIVEFRLLPGVTGDGDPVALPLGWVLSEDAMNAIDTGIARLESNSTAVKIVQAWIAGIGSPPSNCVHSRCNGVGDEGGYTGEAQ